MGGHRRRTVIKSRCVPDLDKGKAHELYGHVGDSPLLISRTWSLINPSWANPVFQVPPCRSHLLARTCNPIPSPCSAPLTRSHILFPSFRAILLHFLHPLVLSWILRLSGPPSPLSGSRTHAHCPSFLHNTHSPLLYRTRSGSVQTV